MFTIIKSISISNTSINTVEQKRDTESFHSLIKALNIQQCISGKGGRQENVTHLCLKSATKK